MSGWHDLDADAALAVLDGWVGRPVVVSVEPADGPAGLAGMAGVLGPAEPPGPSSEAVEFRVGEASGWFRVHRGRAFRGATYAPESRVLVLEVCGEDGFPPVLVDIQPRDPRLPEQP